MINSPSPRPVCRQIFPTLPSKCTLNSVIPSHSVIQAFTALSVCHDKKPLSFSHILTFQAISTEHLPFSSYYSFAQSLPTSLNRIKNELLTIIYKALYGLTSSYLLNIHVHHSPTCSLCWPPCCYSNMSSMFLIAAAAKLLQSCPTLCNP